MLTLTFIAFAVIGCGYVLLAAFLGHVSDGAAHGGHAHAAESHYGVDGSGHGSASAAADGAGAFHFPFFSPLALATLIAAVGGYGLIAQYGLRLGEGASLLVAIPAALATAYGVTYTGWKLASGSRASSMIRLADLKGAAAEVTTPIPRGGLGEAVAWVAGQRYAAPAREITGREVPRGAAVRVVEMVGPTLVVTLENPREGASPAESREGASPAESRAGASPSPLEGGKGTEGLRG
jgi:hypothetical protein